MTTTSRFAIKTILLGSVVVLLSISAANIEFWARQHMMRFESQLGGALFLVSSLVVMMAGIIFSWVLPLNTQVSSLRQATKMALILALIPAVTLFLRVLQWMLILQPFNYEIRNWTMLSATPPLWLGLTLGWWLQVLREQHLSSNG